MPCKFMEDGFLQKTEDSDGAEYLIEVSLKPGTFGCVRIGDVGVEVEEAFLMPFGQGFSRR